MKGKCIVCGKEFEKKTHNKLYCSKQCANFMYSKRRRYKYNNDTNYKNKIKKRNNNNYNPTTAKIYRSKNRLKRVFQCKVWRIKNKEHIKIYKQKYRTHLYYNNIEYKLYVNLSNRVRQALINNYKSKSTKKLVGCSIQHLRSHLESQFTEGMSWDNHGVHGWHLDHIVPCSSFDLSKPEEQKKCFHYTNLQPLWAKDNLSKSNKLDWSRD